MENRKKNCVRILSYATVENRKQCTTTPVFIEQYSYLAKWVCESMYSDYRRDQVSGMFLTEYSYYSLLYDILDTFEAVKLRLQVVSSCTYYALWWFACRYCGDLAKHVAIRAIGRRAHSTSGARSSCSRPSLLLHLPGPGLRRHHGERAQSGVGLHCNILPRW